MARQAPGPTFVDVQYTSAFGPHIARFHTRAWTPPSTGHPVGQVPRWSDDALTDLETMVTDLLAKIANFMPGTLDYNLMTVFTQSAPTALPIPVVSRPITGLTGSVATPGWDQATQQTVVWRDTAGAIAKIVMLDFASVGSFATVRSLPGSGDLFDLNAEFTDEDNAWSSAANHQPATFLGSFRTLNEKLRKAYRMT